MAEAYYDFSDSWSRLLGQGILDECLKINNFEIFSNVKKSDLDGLLLIACNKGDEKLILKLLDFGANKDAKSKGEISAIMYLAQRDLLEMFKHFVNIGAIVSFKNVCVLAGENVKKYIDNDLAVIERTKLEALDKECMTRAKENAILSEKNADLENKLKDAVSEKDKTSIVFDNVVLEKTKLESLTKTISFFPLDDHHVVLEKTKLQSLTKEYITKEREIAILSEKNADIENKLKGAIVEKEKASIVLNDHIALERTKLEALNKECLIRARENAILSEKNAEVEKRNKELSDKVKELFEKFVALADPNIKVSENKLKETDDRLEKIVDEKKSLVIENTNLKSKLAQIRSCQEDRLEKIGDEKKSLVIENTNLKSKLAQIRSCQCEIANACGKTISEIFNRLQ